MSTVFTLLFIVSAVGIWFFTKKQPNKKNRNICIIFSVILAVLIVIVTPNTNKTDSQEKKTTTIFSTTIESDEIPVNSSEIKIDSSSSNEKTDSIVSNSEDKDIRKDSSEELNSINADIKQHLTQNQGFATGSLDPDGNPTENGTPNYDFAWSTLVDEILYDGSQVEVKVNGDFVASSGVDKTLVGDRVQGVVSAILVGYEDLTADEIRNGKFISFYLGENAVGQSKIFNNKEYKWN